MKNNVRTMLSKQGISQAELCRRADALNPTMLSQIASGTKNPSLMTAQRISKALGVAVEAAFPLFRNHHQAGKAGSSGHAV